jgi:hypothetical protein
MAIRAPLEMPPDLVSSSDAALLPEAEGLTTDLLETITGLPRELVEVTVYSTSVAEEDVTDVGFWVRAEPTAEAVDWVEAEAASVEGATKLLVD